MSKTIGIRSTSNAGWGSSHRDRVAGRTGGDPEARDRPTARSARPAGQHDPLGRDDAAARLDAGHAPAAAAVGRGRAGRNAVRSRSSTPAACIASE